MFLLILSATPHIVQYITYMCYKIRELEVDIRSSLVTGATISTHFLVVN